MNHHVRIAHPFLSAHPSCANLIFLFPRAVQIEKRVSGLCGKVVLLVSSGVAPNSDLPSLRTSTFKKYVNHLAIGSTGMLIATVVSIVHVFFLASVLASKPQFIPIDPFTDCCRSFAPSQFPWAEPKASAKVETALTTPRLEDISRIRARNALKIMLDVQGDISS